MKMHRYDYDTVDGKMVEVKCDEIYAWAAVDTKTGEVELGDIRQFDDNLEPLALGWKWVRFTMTPSEVTQPMIANQEFNCPPRCQKCGVCHRGECLPLHP